MATELEQHLREVCASPLFAKSPKLRALLLRMAQPNLDRQQETPKEYTLGVEVFERPESFDPQTDSLVRVSVSRLRGKLQEYYEAEGAGSRIRIQIPKGSYRIEVIRNGVGELPTERLEMPKAERPTRRVMFGWITAGAGASFAGAWWLRRTPRQELKFDRVTYERLNVSRARFGPGGAVLYSVSEGDGDAPIFSVQPGNPAVAMERLPKGDLMDVSPDGEVLILDGSKRLLRGALRGGPFREVAKETMDATWLPGGEFATVRIDEGVRSVEMPNGHRVCEIAGNLTKPMLRANRKGTALVFADNSKGHLDATIVDRSGKVTVVSTAWYRAGGFTWASCDCRVLFGGNRNGTTVIVQAGEGEKEQVLYQSGPGMAVHDTGPDGLLVDLCDSRLEVVFGGQAGEAERVLTLPNTNMAARDMSPAGDEIALEDMIGGGNGNRPLWIWQKRDNTTTWVGSGNRPRYTPDGQRLLWVDAEPTKPAIVEHWLSSRQSRRHELPVGHSYYSVEQAGNPAQFLVAVTEGRARVSYLYQSGSGKLRPLPGGPGMVRCVSPDGRRAILAAGTSVKVFDLERGNMVPVDLARGGWHPLRWAEDGESVFLWEPEGMLGRMVRVNTRTSSRQVIRDLAAKDPFGTYSVGFTAISSSGEAYTFTYGRDQSTLYLARGIV